VKIYKVRMADGMDRCDGCGRLFEYRRLSHCEYCARWNCDQCECACGGKSVLLDALGPMAAGRLFWKKL